ncbi:16S rRNA (uracil(1498)-N(3))-methyltransferase [Sulfurovum riftiae]|uniref:Ribosomal RNA small subunit methyltransferase E n=1 Tax=Sulfurovum riftiae TaxID=1630136 RepID=A0A151CHP6_9BACT|nr:16S rRNA (uracil(1498)-N(3))-methyltransferase [Sulfurovum riftiae]KYJ87019.1 16S rRNA methyltransferase [Sulfurovum riftiae]
MNCVLLPKNTKTIRDEQQVRHIKEVLKAKVGDNLTIGEIGGNIGKATLAQINTNEVILTDITLDKKPPAKLDLTVVLALPRPKVLRRLIMDMTSLGVNRLIIVNSYRTQKSYWQSPLLNRIDEFVFEGLQQAIDTMPPVIEFKKRFKPFVEDEFGDLLTEEDDAVVAHPYAEQSWKAYLDGLKSKSNHENIMPKILCIGAEGGWIAYEVDLFCKHGCTSVSLGERILRTETVVSVLLGHWLAE